MLSLRLCMLLLDSSVNLILWWHIPTGKILLVSCLFKYIVWSRSVIATREVINPPLTCSCLLFELSSPDADWLSFFEWGRCGLVIIIQRDVLYCCLVAGQRKVYESKSFLHNSWHALACLPQATGA